MLAYTSHIPNFADQPGSKTKVKKKSYAWIRFVQLQLKELMFVVLALTLF